MNYWEDENTVVFGNLGMLDGMEMLYAFFVLLNVWAKNKPAFTSLISSFNSEVFFNLHKICEILIETKYEFNEITLIQMGFKENYQRFLEPDMTMCFLSDILEALKYKLGLTISNSGSITAGIKNKILAIKKLKRLEIYDFLNLDLNDFPDLEELGISVMGHSEIDLKEDSLANNLKLKKVSFYFDYNHGPTKYLNKILNPLINLKEIFIEGIALDTKFFTELSTKLLEKITIKSNLPQTDSNTELFNFFKTQENSLKSCEMDILKRNLITTSCEVRLCVIQNELWISI